MAKQTNNEPLVIVPCGRSKIWDKIPDAGSVPAKEAYKGAPFKVNRQYAECFSREWIILSAKYGFISPDYEIPGPYEVTFKRKNDGRIPDTELRQQVSELGLDRFSLIIGLGGKEYRAAISAAFRDLSVELCFPFAGLPIGKAMRATKEAIAKSNLS